MDNELRRYYEDRFSMMASDGWSDLIEDVQCMIDSIDTLSGVTTENLHFKQGELSILRWLVSLKDVSEQSYQELENAPAS